MKIKYRFANLWLLTISCIRQLSDEIRNDVPYVSQFASPEYAEKILKERVGSNTDPHWQYTGAQSVEEYAKWVLTICGMACTSMALLFFKHRNYGVVSLANDAFKHSVYKINGKELSNMHYAEYVPWIRTYGLKATIYTHMRVRGLQYLLSKEKLVIVSVNPNIRGYKTADPKQKGGHLVLVTGYDKKRDVVMFHNPSGFARLNTQENHTLSVREFCQFFAGRGIALSSL